MKIRNLNTRSRVGKSHRVSDGAADVYVDGGGFHRRLPARRARAGRRGRAFCRVLFDSGLREGVSSLGFAPEIALRPRTPLWWRVEVVADDGDRAVSEAAWFETGKRGEPWSAKWIRAPFEAGVHPILSRGFELRRSRRARGFTPWGWACTSSRSTEAPLATRFSRRSTTITTSGFSAGLRRHGAAARGRKPARGVARQRLVSRALRLRRRRGVRLRRPYAADPRAAGRNARRERVRPRKRRAAALPPLARARKQHLRRRSLRRSAGALRAERSRRRGAAAGRADRRPPVAAAAALRPHGAEGADPHAGGRTGAGLRPGDDRLGGIRLRPARGRAGRARVRRALAARQFLPREPALGEGALRLCLRPDVRPARGRDLRSTASATPA